jgi:hypothetical protein
MDAITRRIWLGGGQNVVVVVVVVVVVETLESMKKCRWENC